MLRSAAVHDDSTPDWPYVGQLVSLSRRRFRRRQHVGTGAVRTRAPGELVIALGLPVEGLGRRARVTLEWVDPDGLAHADVRAGVDGELLVASTRSEPVLIQRREDVRVPLELPIRAWSLLAPTTLIEGTTVNVSAGGLLARVTGLPPAAALLDLQVVANGGVVHASGEVVRRKGEEVAVLFERLSALDEARLVGLLGEELVLAVA
jgi:hypothetical protein